LAAYYDSERKNSISFIEIKKTYLKELVIYVFIHK